jgi:hypothetical protein
MSQPQEPAAEEPEAQEPAAEEPEAEEPQAQEHEAEEPEAHEPEAWEPEAWEQPPGTPSSLVKRALHGISHPTVILAVLLMAGIAVLDNPSALIWASAFGFVAAVILSSGALLVGGAVLWVDTIRSTLATVPSLFITFGILMVTKISYPFQFSKWWPVSLIVIGVFSLSATLTSEARPWINAISVAVGTLCCFLVPTKTDHREFYELTAQIVPVLFIALAIEMRAYRLSQERAGPLTLRVAYLPAIALVAAGFEALRVLATGQPSTGNLRFVAASMTIATVSLALLAILESDDQHSI